MPTQLSSPLPHRFAQPALLKQALTHTSYANEHRHQNMPSNERMEFLGDSILSVVVSEALYQRFVDWDEGQLSRLRSQLVSEKSLAEVARKLGLSQHVLLGKGERLSGGARRDSVLADTLEAYLAAVYLDTHHSAGLARVRALVVDWFVPQLVNQTAAQNNVDAKTALQEWMQKQVKQTAQYVVLREEGPDHAKHFVITARFGALELGRGEGSSKKIAEQAAARIALSSLQNAQVVLPKNPPPAG